MTNQTLKVGQVVKAVRDILLLNDNHIELLTSPVNKFLPKGTEAEIMAIEREHVELNCKDGAGHGIHAWGLRIRVAKVVWWSSFE